MIHSRGSSNGTLSAATAAATAAAEDGSDPRDWADMYEDYLDAELEEDEEIESYYFSSAAGRARVVLGNRRWGEGGYMRAGGERGGETWGTKVVWCGGGRRYYGLHPRCQQGARACDVAQCRACDDHAQDAAYTRAFCLFCCLQVACMLGPWCTLHAHPTQQEAAARQQAARPLARPAPVQTLPPPAAASSLQHQDHPAMGQVAAVGRRAAAVRVRAPAPAVAGSAWRGLQQHQPLRQLPRGLMMSVDLMMTTMTSQSTKAAATAGAAVGTAETAAAAAAARVPA